ncbi:unnamed protein product [Ectocarpus sp. 12 AP-2014]
MLAHYTTALVLLGLPLGIQGFVPLLANNAAGANNGAATTPTPGTTAAATGCRRRQHEHRIANGPSSLCAAPPAHALRAAPRPASPASLPEYFMALFGGNKGSSATKTSKAEELEADLLSAIEGVQGRGRDVTQEQRELVDKAVEALESDGGVPKAASSPAVDGSWRLIFTTTPGTASPVQRSFVGVDGFAIYQDIDLFSEVPPTVTNVVDFGPRVGQLRVTALASTPSRPMEGFVPRKGDGRFFGLNILGVSQTTPPEDPSRRIDFQFDEAGFDFKALPFNIPYPVPFRLFGDEVKGWIDVTYLSKRLRIARGNKGTLFVLQRPPSPPPP